MATALLARGETRNAPGRAQRSEVGSVGPLQVSKTAHAPMALPLRRVSTTAAAHRLRQLPKGGGRDAHMSQVSARYLLYSSSDEVSCLFMPALA